MKKLTMQKIIKLVLILMFSYLFYEAIESLLVNPKQSNESNIQKFIVGTWEIQETEELYRISEIDFVDSNTLILDIESPEDVHYNLVFEYKFTNENTIELTGRINEKWQISRVDNLLVVKSYTWPEKNTEFFYKRLQIINFLAIALLLGVINIYIYINYLFQFHRRNETYTKKNSVPRFFANFILILISIPLSLRIWEWSPFLKIRLPWDAVFSIETSILIILLTFISNSWNSKIMFAPLRLFLYTVGAIGFGINFIKIIIFIFYGSYLN